MYSKVCERHYIETAALQENINILGNTVIE